MRPSSGRAGAAEAQAENARKHAREGPHVGRPAVRHSCRLHASGLCWGLVLGGRGLAHRPPLGLPVLGTYLLGAWAGGATTNTGAAHSGLTAVGYNSLYNTTGGFNTALGDDAGVYNTSGEYNTFIGNQAGKGDNLAKRHFDENYWKNFSLKNNIIES